VSEVRDRVIGEIGSQHVANRFRIKQTQPGALLRQERSGGRLASTEDSVEPNDRTPNLAITGVRSSA
jgi:hypothetical protein